jgi:ABC-type sugar transport system permease subunit
LQQNCTLTTEKKWYIMIQVYKEAFKAQRSDYNVASALKALIHVYHTLFFIIPALQSENYNKKSKLKYLFRSNLCHH